MGSPDCTPLARWRAARRATLAAILVAGTIATSAAVAQRMFAGCPDRGRDDDRVGRHVTYDGIGIAIDRHGDRFVIERVFAGTPADGKLYPGAILVAADGEHPDTIEGWAGRIRGVAGSELELEVAYPQTGHETVVLTRARISLRR
jgi:hypothetical protein